MNAEPSGPDGIVDRGIQVIARVDAVALSPGYQK
jgi:hypothetical protein